MSMDVDYMVNPAGLLVPKPKPEPEETQGEPRQELPVNNAFILSNATCNNCGKRVHLDWKTRQKLFDVAPHGESMFAHECSCEWVEELT